MVPQKFFFAAKFLKNMLISISTIKNENSAIPSYIVNMPLGDSEKLIKNCLLHFYMPKPSDMCEHHFSDFLFNVSNQLRLP